MHVFFPYRGTIFQLDLRRAAPALSVSVRRVAEVARRGGQCALIDSGAVDRL